MAFNVPPTEPERRPDMEALQRRWVWRTVFLGCAMMWGGVTYLLVT